MGKNRMSKQYDPKMHSAEHLLNQAMVRKFGCNRCFSAHINKKKSKCDYHFDRRLTTTEVGDIERDVNEQIRKNLKVRIEQLPKASAQRTLNLVKVPGVDTLNDIRVVYIGDYDACACVGPHVESTHQIGVFKITTTGFENGILRIRYKLQRNLESK